MKLSVKIAGFATAFAFAIAAATPASAQTAAELQALIAQLQAQIAALSGTTVTVPTTTFTYTRDLTIGSTGPDVVALQTFLETKGKLIIPGGTSKGYFGVLTRSALANYQASAGIAPAVGYFGPITKAKVMAEGINVIPGTQTPGTTTTPGTTPGSSTTLKGGAGDLDITSRSSGTEDEVNEGEEEVPVLGFEAEAQGSDIAVTSVRVEFKQSDSAGSKRFNRYADEVQIMLGDEVVGSADVRDFKESSDVYSYNIPVKGAVVREDDTERFYVAVTANDVVDSKDINKKWDVTLGQVRFEDATGVVLTTDGGSTPIKETFSFQDLASSGDLRLTVREDDNSINDARPVKVSDSSTTKNVDILSFEIEAKDSDVTLNSLSAQIESATAGVTEIANDFTLYMDGEEVGRVNIDTSDSASGFTATSSANIASGNFNSTNDVRRVLTFYDLDDDDVVIEKGDTVSFVIKADINKIGGNFTNGSKFVSVMLNSNTIDAEDENGDRIVAADLTGSAEARNLSFLSAGIMLNAVSQKGEQVKDPNNSTNNTGEYTLKFDVEAFDRTVYIPLTSVRGASTTVGASYTLENGSGVVTTGTSSDRLRLSSTGNKTTVGGVDYVKINTGSTATFELSVSYDPTITGFYNVQLENVNFKFDTAGTPDTTQNAVPSEDFDTDAPNVQS